MDIRQLLQADYLDILFDQRNKRYGGYELRKHYPDRARKAMMVVLLATGIAAAIPVIASRNSETRVLPPSTVVTDLKEIIKPPVEKPKEPLRTAAPAPELKPPTVGLTVPKIVENNITDNIMKPVDTLDGKVIGPHDSPGDDGASLTADISQPPGKGKSGLGDDAGESKATVFVYVEQMPEFNGEIGNYLRGHLQYPEEAREIGYEGKVIVKFVVNEDGGISNAEVVQGGGHGLEREALRVVSGMPKWRPGKQNGQPVKVYFLLPISFKLDN